MHSVLPRPEAAEPLARLLLQWGHAPRPQAPVAERLGGWLGWADAIGLSQLLATPAAAGRNEAACRSALDWAEAALARLQAELADAFDDALLARESAEPAPEAVPQADLLAPYRLHHSQQQRSMAARVGTLRERLRPRLVEASGPLGHLAQLDALFERATAPQERERFAGLAGLWSQRAERQHAADPRHWRARAWADLQRLLRAELDLRLQPVLGLLEALQAEAPR